MESRVRVRQGEIVVGNPLQHDVYDEKDVLLLKKGHLIQSQRQLDALLDRGLFLKDPSTAPRIKDTQILTSKAPTPFDLMDEIYQKLSALYNSPEKIDFPSRILTFCQQIQTVCKLNPDAALGSIFLNQGWNYAVYHQIHCALICEILLSQLGGNPQDRLPLLGACLTMNIAMAELQEVLFTKRENLTEKEKVQIMAHPLASVELLKKHGVEDEIWLKTVLQHHEFRGGSGYPQGLQGEEIDHLARILTIADVYTAKLSPRAYRNPLPPMIAAREVFTGSRGQVFDQELSRIFLREFGIFHPGAFVRLANGEIALVTFRGKKIYHPVVHSIARPDGLPLASPKERDCSREEFKITESLSPDKVRININRLLLWGYWSYE